MQIQVRISDRSGIIDIDKFHKQLSKNIGRGFRKGLIHLQSKTVKALYDNKYNIRQRSGAAGLAGSIAVKTRVAGNKVTAQIGSNLAYARIQEKGGKINVTRRMSKFAWYKYKDTGQTMWKAIALSKGRHIRIPAHKYLQNSVDDNKAGMLRIIQREIIKGLK